MKKFFLTTATALLVSAAGASYATPVVYDVVLDTATIDGGGTITVDDSLLVANATITGPQMVIDIMFNGLTFDSVFNSPPEGLILDGTGTEFVATTLIGSFFEFLAGGSTANYISIDNGPLPSSFTTNGSAVGNYSGNFSISRSVAAVPIPAAGFLLIGALGGLGLAGRRRKKS